MKKFLMIAALLLSTSAQADAFEYGKPKLLSNISPDDFIIVEYFYNPGVAYCFRFWNQIYTVAQVEELVTVLFDRNKLSLTIEGASIVCESKQMIYIKEDGTREVLAIP